MLNYCRYDNTVTVSMELWCDHQRALDTLARFMGVNITPWF